MLFSDTPRHKKPDMFLLYVYICSVYHLATIHTYIQRPEIEIHIYIPWRDSFGVFLITEDKKEAGKKMGGRGGEEQGLWDLNIRYCSDEYYQG